MQLAPSRICAVAFAMLSLVGCGGDEESAPEESPGQPAEVNPQVAKATAQTVVSAVNQAMAGDGLSAAFSMAAIGQSAFTMLTPTGAAPQALPGGLGEAKQKIQTGTCECGPSSCTFEGCSDDGLGAAWVIDGTLSWADGHIDCDLTISGDLQGLRYDFHEACALVVTSTSIDGSLDTDGSYQVSQSGQSAQAAWDAAIDFNDVQLSAGCPASGSVDVEASVSYSGASYSGEGSVTFDGGC